jgi:hypothetical protein
MISGIFVQTILLLASLIGRTGLISSSLSGHVSLFDPLENLLPGGYVGFYSFNSHALALAASFNCIHHSTNGLQTQTSIIQTFVQSIGSTSRLIIPEHGL